jgi:glycosyltransferase involved in cell wall biosynthesis
MTCGGAEKSLLSLLQTINYDRYDVDVFLFKHSGLFLDKLPDSVRLLPAPKLYPVFDATILDSIRLSRKERRYELIVDRLMATLLMRTERNKAVCEQRMWKYISKSLDELNQEYDCAIGFLEKNPIYFIVDKVKARRKIGFIHSDYERYGMDPKLDAPFFERLDIIASVSESSVNSLKRVFPIWSSKIRLMHNIVSEQAVRDMAEEPLDWKEQGIHIVSVGRLTKSKGFELAVEASELLRKAGYPVFWHIIGEGEELSRLVELVKSKGLQKVVLFEGLQPNPYPYIKKCDIYVQTSLHEGRCLTISEAKILRKPIVATNFETVHDQIKSGQNGMIVEMDPDAVAHGIISLIENPSLAGKLAEALANEPIGNAADIEKFYEYVS